MLLDLSSSLSEKEMLSPDYLKDLSLSIDLSTKYRDLLYVEAISSFSDGVENAKPMLPVGGDGIFHF